jgi:hypothetical protein
MTIEMPFLIETYEAYETPPYSWQPLQVDSFASAEEALACAKKVIDDQLRKIIESGRSAKDAINLFSIISEVSHDF